jgi:hypothetical protein
MAIGAEEQCHRRDRLARQGSDQCEFIYLHAYCPLTPAGVPTSGLRVAAPSFSSRVRRLGPVDSPHAGKCSLGHSGQAWECPIRVARAGATVPARDSGTTFQVQYP